MLRARSDRGRDLLCVALLAAIVCVVFLQFLTLASTFHRRDVALFIYPERHIVWERERAGDWIPMWNFHPSNGQPLAANAGYNVFYPPVWLLAAIPDFNFAFNLFFVAHFLVAGISMFALLRSLDASRTASTAGAVSWMLGGMMLSFATLPLFLYGCAWLPLFALFARRFLIAPRTIDFALASLVLGAIITIGEAAVILECGALLAGYALARALRKQMTLGRAVGLTAAIVAGGILVGTAQLVPLLNLQKATARAEGFSFESLSTWSLAPSRPLELLLPDAVRPPREPLILSFYPGLLAGALAIAAFATRRRGWRFAAIVAVVSYLFAIGGPAFRILYGIGLRNVRFPEKLFIPAVFILTIFASLAIDEIPRVRTAAAVTLAVIFAGALVMRTPAAAIGSAVLLAIVLLQPRVRPAVWSACVVAFVVADLAPRVLPLIEPVPASYYTPPPVASRFPAETRIYNDAQWSTFLYDRPHIDAAARPWFVRNALFPRLSNAWGFDSAFDLDVNMTSLVNVHDLGALMFEARDRGRPDRVPLLMSMAGVTHVITAPPLRLDATGNPRFYFADPIVTVRSREDFRQAIRSRVAWPPRVAFVPARAFAPAPGHVIRAVESPDRIDLDVEADGAALLVATVTGHKDWSATLDGAPAPIIPANLAMQSIAVPRGRHTIVMRYRDPVVIASAVVSAIAVLILITASVRAAAAGAAPRR